MILTDTLNNLRCTTLIPSETTNIINSIGEDVGEMCGIIEESVYKIDSFNIAIEGYTNRIKTIESSLDSIVSELHIMNSEHGIEIFSLIASVVMAGAAIWAIFENIKISRRSDKRNILTLEIERMKSTLAELK